jgi:hypothetical protein
MPAHSEVAISPTDIADRPLAVDFKARYVSAANSDATNTKYTAGMIQSTALPVAGLMA